MPQSNGRHQGVSTPSQRVEKFLRRLGVERRGAARVARDIFPPPHRLTIITVAQLLKTLDDLGILA